jgi:hypothetical protein
MQTKNELAAAKEESVTIEAKINTLHAEIENEAALRQDTVRSNSTVFGRLQTLTRVWLSQLDAHLLRFSKPNAAPLRIARQS